MRPYAIDSHGRTSWDRAEAFYRFFFDAGWQPANKETSLAEPSPHRLYVAPVVPVWQFWKPKALRGSWRRWLHWAPQSERRKALRTVFTAQEAERPS